MVNVSLLYYYSLQMFQALKLSCYLIGVNEVYIQDEHVKDFKVKKCVLVNGTKLNNKKNKKTTRPVRYSDTVKGQ